MNGFIRLMAAALLSASAVHAAQAAFSSLYVFGDGVCTTTDNPSRPYYYGNRYCNGRIWIELLAQRQGIVYDASKNLSYFGHYSSDLITELAHFSAADASTALFVVWVNDADFVHDMNDIYPDTGTLPGPWNAAISASLTNQFQAVTNLYARGARTLIMPNAVDITKVPGYSGTPAADKSFIRQRIMSFNASFSNLLNQAKAISPGLTIYIPDFFTLLDTIVAHPAGYGLINPATDALEDPNLSDLSLNGPGANYVFWDYLDPTAKAHVAMVGVVQQMISPVKITHLALLTGSNRLDALNIPVGLNGLVDGRTNLASGSWTSLTNFNSVTTTQAIFVPAAGSWRYYRLRFPFVWTWP